MRFRNFLREAAATDIVTGYDLLYSEDDAYLPNEVDKLNSVSSPRKKADTIRISNADDKFSGKILSLDNFPKMINTLRLSGVDMKSLSSSSIQQTEFISLYLISRLTTLEGMPACDTLSITACKDLVSLTGCTAQNLSIDTGIIFKLKSKIDYSTLPKKINRLFLKDVSNIPKIIDHLPDCNLLTIKVVETNSLHGIGDTTATIKTITTNATTNLLGLLKIKGLQSIEALPDLPSAVSNIINKYLPCGPNDKKKLMACQDELIDAGFDEAANL